MSNRTWILCAIAAVLSKGCAAPSAMDLLCNPFAGLTDISHEADPDNRGVLRVMSFNLRLPMPLDLHNFWPLRKNLLTQTIKNYNPDVLGTQECVASQAQYLQQQLPEYNFIGAGRNDGQQSGEMCGVFYRAAKFEELDHGHFWLSDHPDKPGSKSWGTWFTRMATWVKLRSRADGSVFYFFNTHLDSNSKRARLEGARLLRSKIAAIAGDSPVVLAGDFNTGEGTAPYQALLNQTHATPAHAPPGLLDTFRQAHADRSSAEGSFHGFSGNTRGDRIDWIFTSANVTTLQADINRTHAGGRFPSDHFPVTALLKLTPALPDAPPSPPRAATTPRDPAPALTTSTPDP